MKCRTCEEEMDRIKGPGMKRAEYSCENCGDYRNAKGQWRSYRKSWTPKTKEEGEA